VRDRHAAPRNALPDEELSIRGAGEQRTVGASESEVSSSPSANNIQDQRKQNAEQDASRQWKIEGRVLAAINDVARQFANRQVCALQEHKHETRDHQQESEEDQELAKIHHAGGAWNMSIASLSMLDCSI
jgi:hypothetical protein